MRYEFVDGKLYLRRTFEEREPLLQRLSRIEGQVRGLRQMLEDDRYCGDEVHLASAITSAVREVSLLIISQHIEAGIDCAVSTQDDAPVQEMLALLRAALKL